MDREIIVFDTECLLCSGLVAFVLRHERDRALAFADAWSDEGLALAERHGFSKADLDTTFLVLRGDHALTRSTAALALARHLRAPWRWLGLARLVPRPVRDRLYDAVARHRTRWFGRRPDCVIVPAAQAHRFIGMRSAPAAERRR